MNDPTLVTGQKTNIPAKGEHWKRTLKAVIGFSLLALFFFGCSEEKRKGSLNSNQPDVFSSKSMEVQVSVPVLNAQHVPSSRRSRDVMKRMAPKMLGVLKSKGLEYGAPIFIRIFKRERELELWVQKDDRFQLFKTYGIAGMSGGLGPKMKEGDRQAPEGFYDVPPSMMNPNSRYHLSFNLGYPNSYDRFHGRTGSALMVHGNRVSIGCFAMTDSRVEEIYCLAEAALRKGQKSFRVHAFPFRMTQENMERHKGSRWLPFWNNLKEGYDWFEVQGVPPNVEIERGNYVFY